MTSQFLNAGFLWMLLVLICIIVFLFGLKKAFHQAGFPPPERKKNLTVATVFIMLWIVLLAVLSFSGFFADFSKLPPRPALAMLLPLPLVLLFAFSKTGTKLLQVIPPYWLVLFQSFRIFVEVLLWLAFFKNLLPVQMTFEGRNFDVIIGILALPVSYFIRNKITSAKTIAVFNIIGLLLLLNILIIAVLSMPGSLRYFMNEPSNTLVAQFPFILLPGVLVPFAYSFHIFSLRQLFIKK